MVEQAGALPSEAETNLTDSRAQFVGSLGRRLEALRQALSLVEQSPESSALRDQLRRRLHAFGAAAGVLGFERAFEALRAAEGRLGRSGSAAGTVDIGAITRTLDDLPSLVFGTAATSTSSPGPSTTSSASASWPVSVVVFGPGQLAEPFESSGGDCEQTEDPARAEELVRNVSPDVVLVDADKKGAFELLETLANNPLLDPVRVVVVGAFDSPEAAAKLIALGVARVLAKPVTPDLLERAVGEVAREHSNSVLRLDALGDVTVESLGERLAEEVRRGLVDALAPALRATPVSLGNGTDVLAAIWASLARVREVVTLRSGGKIRFEQGGPEGAIPVSPWMDERAYRGAATERRAADGVDLSGRTIVVADDDPSIVWFLSGLLRAAGADVLEALDGAQALDLAREAWPDLVVSDILMPELDGFSLCRELKRDVALGDVPVILLSWKEDLLQRVRELGAMADGYLRKEAASSAVVQRIREVLVPRSRIETRLRGSEEARGRLDGLTTRLVLSLACKYRQSSLVTVRDATFLYEIAIRGGRVRSVTRTTADGTFERGVRALEGLLGVRAGRFSVRTDEARCHLEWDEELTELLRDPVERARAATRVLADPSKIRSVEIDSAVLESYSAALPPAVGAALTALSSGGALATLFASGPVGLVESALLDLALRGAIAHAFDGAGVDLLATERTALRERSRLARSAAPTPPPPPAFVGTPTGPLATPLEMVPKPPPPEPLAAAPNVPPTAPPATASSFASAVPPAEAKPETNETFAMLLSLAPPPVAPTEERRESRPGMKALAPPTSAPPEGSPLELALRSVPSPVPASVVVGAGGSAEAAVEASPSPTLTVTGAREPVAAPAPKPSPPRPQRILEAERPPSPPPNRGQAPSQVKGAEDTVQEMDLSDALLNALGQDDEPKLVAKDEQPAPPVTKEPQGDLANAAFAAPVIFEKTEPSAPPPESARTRTTDPPKRVKEVPRPRSATNTASKTAASPATNAAKASSPRETAGALAIVAIAGLSTFALVTAVRGPAGSPESNPSASAVPPRPRVPVASASSAASAGVHGKPSLSAEDLDLPADVALQAGRGLLELDVPAGAAVSIDDVLIGTATRVPLREGRHEARVRGAGLDLSRTIELRAGRRVRLGIMNAQ